jgi:hypothetical protein
LSSFAHPVIVLKHPLDRRRRPRVPKCISPHTAHVHRICIKFDRGIPHTHAWLALGTLFMLNGREHLDTRHVPRTTYLAEVTRHWVPYAIQRSKTRDEHACSLVKPCTPATSDHPSPKKGLHSERPRRPRVDSYIYVHIPYADHRLR